MRSIETTTKAFKGGITPLLGSIQLTELYTPFLRANDPAGPQNMKLETAKLEPKIRKVDKEIAETAWNRFLARIFRRRSGRPS